MRGNLLEHILRIAALAIGCNIQSLISACVGVRDSQGYHDLAILGSFDVGADVPGADAWRGAKTSPANGCADRISDGKIRWRNARNDGCRLRNIKHSGNSSVDEEGAYKRANRRWTQLSGIVPPLVVDSQRGSTRQSNGCRWRVCLTEFASFAASPRSPNT